MPLRYRLILYLTAASAFAMGLTLPNLLRAPLRSPDAKTRPVSPRGDLTPEEAATIELFRRASPSVVYITNLALRRDPFSLNVHEIPQGTGSGFIWSQDGYIVTNFHVVRGGQAFQVTLADNSSWSATAVGAEPDKDLAVLKIDDPPPQLTPIDVGTSSDLQVGQSVLAIGNPFGLDQTLTTGIISALGRQISSVSDRPIRDVIQTDAAINPGNSGGPLLDSAGRLIGVNTAILSQSGSYAGIGFAVPADTVNEIVPQLIAHGRVIRPGLGIVPAAEQVMRRLGITGVLVLEVTQGSGADRAGVQPTSRDRMGRIVLGDVIVSINGAPVTSNGSLRTLLEDHSAGDTVRVGIQRGRRQLELEVELTPLS